MKKTKKLILSAIVSLCLVSIMEVLAQTPTDAQKAKQRTTAITDTDKENTKKTAQDPTKKPRSGDRLEPDDTRVRPSDVPPETEANRHEQLSEEAAIVPYYNNFFTTYRLGPQDVISVVVFNQERYSRSGIVVPPNGRISLALIQGGIFVNGKTVDEVAELIKKKYDEFIIDPQVTVSLDKASSYRYSVIGDVGQPGIHLMDHRLTVTEALAEAGGVLPTGNKSKVVVLRRQQNGILSPIAVNVSEIYKGKAADNVYLVPGDQIVVPGNKLKTLQKLMGFASVLSFARIFGL
jgi:protein involved in polysaccharide export with SLBB domain